MRSARTVSWFPRIVLDAKSTLPFSFCLVSKVFTKKGKLGNGFTSIHHVFQTATKKPYTNPVYLLITTESANATDIMILPSFSIPTVIRIGFNTEGVFSNILDKTLHNRWEFELSSEVYIDLTRDIY